MYPGRRMWQPMRYRVTISPCSSRCCPLSTALCRHGKNPNPTGPDRHAGGSLPRLDITQLSHTIQELFVAGLVGSKQRVYKSGERRYTGFCTAAALPPFPASKSTLIAFVVFLYREGLSASSAKLYVVAVRHTQIAFGMGDPQMISMPKLEYTIKGMQRVTPWRKRYHRLSITPSVMRRLKGLWERLPRRENAVMLWAASCLCFFGFLRMGEVIVQLDTAYDLAVHLNWEDVRVNSRSQPQWLKVRIKASKSDHFRQGVYIYVGAMGEWLCPVAAVLSYMAQDTHHESPLFRFKDGSPLTKARSVMV